MPRRRLLSLLLALWCCTAEGADTAIWSPSYGARSGLPFRALLRLPAAPAGFRTSRVEVTVPHGVRNVTAVGQPGWNAAVPAWDAGAATAGATVVVFEATRAIAGMPALPTSPAALGSEAQGAAAAGRPGARTAGPRVSGGPEAAGAAVVAPPAVPAIPRGPKRAAGAQPLEFELEFHLGCDFNNASEATEWMGFYALWWRTVQHLSPEAAPSAAASSGDSRRLWVSIPASASAPWGAGSAGGGSGPCPFTLVASDAACGGAPEAAPAGHRRGGRSGGMRWLGKQVPSAPAGAEAAARLVAELEERAAAHRSAEAGGNELEEKAVGVETDRDFDGHDPRAHDHSRDYRKGHRGGGSDESQSMGGGLGGALGGGLGGGAPAEDQAEENPLVENSAQKAVVIHGAHTVVGRPRRILKVMALLGCSVLLVLGGISVSAGLAASAQMFLRDSHERRKLLMAKSASDGDLEDGGDLAPAGAAAEALPETAPVGPGGPPSETALPSGALAAPALPAAEAVATASPTAASPAEAAATGADREAMAAEKSSGSPAAGAAAAARLLPGAGRTAGPAAGAAAGGPGRTAGAPRLASASAGGAGLGDVDPQVIGAGSAAGR